MINVKFPGRWERTVWRFCLPGLFTLFNCQPPKSMTIQTLTEADRGQQVDLAPGQTIRILLPENPTTGYRWAVVESDTSVIELEQDDYGPNQGGAVGGSGQRSFTFRALGPGRAGLQLSLRREWESNVPATAQFDATVNVRE